MRNPFVVTCADESFYVINGEIASGFGDSKMVAAPGTLVHLPAGTTRGFRSDAAAVK